MTAYLALTTEHSRQFTLLRSRSIEWHGLTRPVEGSLVAFVGDAMFGWSKEEKFVKNVETSMAFLLSFQGENFVRAIYKHYPNAKTVAVDKMKEGLPENRVASEILRIALTDQIDSHITADQRSQLATYLASDEPLENAPFALAKLCRAYVTMMFRESDLKKQDEAWVKDCVHDVYFAAKGMNRDQRSADRMVRAFENATTA